MKDETKEGWNKVIPEDEGRKGQRKEGTHAGKKEGRKDGIKKENKHMKEENNLGGCLQLPRASTKSPRRKEGRKEGR
jgi:hypothetical protein